MLVVIGVVLVAVAAVVAVGAVAVVAVVGVMAVVAVVAGAVVLSVIVSSKRYIRHYDQDGKLRLVTGDQAPMLVKRLKEPFSWRASPPSICLESTWEKATQIRQIREISSEVLPDFIACQKSNDSQSF